eukprot:1142657-Pelagomonas_calceolata.AAC.3
MAQGCSGASSALNLPSKLCTPPPSAPTSHAAATPTHGHDVFFFFRRCTNEAHTASLEGRAPVMTLVQSLDNQGHGNHLTARCIG